MNEAINCFQRLGLTQYESSALAGLFSKHDATAQEISELSNVPYTKIYAVLNSLEKQGLLKTTLERPKKYRPVSPDSVVQSLLDRKKQEVEYLENRTSDNLDVLNGLFKEGESAVRSESVWHVQTVNAVWDEVLKTAKLAKRETIVIADDHLWELASAKKGLGEIAYKAAKNGVKQRALVPSDIDFSKSKLSADFIKAVLHPNFSIRIVERKRMHLPVYGADKERLGAAIMNPQTFEMDNAFVFADKKLVASWWDYFDMLWNLADPAPNFILQKIKSKLRGK